MIAAEARLLTYVEAAERLGRGGSAAAKAKFIQRRAGAIVVTVLGHKTRRISEMDLQKYIERNRAVEKTVRRKK